MPVIFTTSFHSVGYSLDPDADGLTFTFKENGHVTVKSRRYCGLSFNNFDSVTEAYNIEMLTTNKTTNDTVHGDSER